MTRKLVTRVVVEAFVPTAWYMRFGCLRQAPLQLFLSTVVTKHGRAFDARIARSNVRHASLKARGTR